WWLAVALICRSRDAHRVEAYERDMRWQEERRHLAKEILKGSAEAYRSAWGEMSPLANAKLLGTSLELQYISNTAVALTLRVDDKDVIPGQSYALLSSGQLSVKDQPKAKYNEIYQD